MNGRRRSSGNRVRIAKRKESQEPETYEIQPRILRKLDTIATADESDDKKQSEEVKPDKKPEVPCMKVCATLVSCNNLHMAQLINFLDFDNPNFCAVGVIGMKGSGKSTVLNLIATGDANSSVFSYEFTRNGVEAFITENRMILLDSAPILINTSGREFVVSEADDIRQIQALLCLCHELLIVYENHQLMNLIRMLICAKSMMKPYECDEPEITLVECRSRPGCASHPITDVARSLLMANNVSDSIHVIKVPDFDRVKPHHDDPLDSINQLRDDINTRKELKAYEEPLDTEKTWWDRFVKLDLEGSELVMKFESLRVKYYQDSLKDLNSGSDKRSIRK